MYSRTSRCIILFNILIPVDWASSTVTEVNATEPVIMQWRVVSGEKRLCVVKKSVNSSTSSLQWDRLRMVSGKLVTREESTDVHFCVSEGWLYLTYVGLYRSQLNCSGSVHFRLWERPLILLREHILYVKDSDNIRPVAIAVPDDRFLGKLGPIIWLSFLHLYHFYQKERYGFGTLVMPCFGMVAYISIYVLFVQYWRHSWDVLWDWCTFSQTVNLQSLCITSRGT